MSAASGVVQGFALAVIWYFIALNTAWLIIITLAAAGAVTARWRQPFSGLADIFHSPLAPGVSVIVPVRNMADLAVGTVRGLLNLRYPRLEVIVVDDGSTDGTLAVLAQEFGLRKVTRVVRGGLATGAVRSVHAPAGSEPLLVVTKEGTGGPADAVNVGVNMARYPLTCRIDAGTYLDEAAVLAAVQPFLADPDATVAAALAIRVANGSRLRAGRIVEPRVPGGWLLPIQAAEYLRVYLTGRAGESRLSGMGFIGGVSGLLQREMCELAGGFRGSSGTGDVELAISIHRRLREERRSYRSGFVPDPCCWAVVPGSYRQLARQRVRWSRTLCGALWANRAMLCNPRYGLAGLVVLPGYLFFGLLSAPIELLAVAGFAAGWGLGLLTPGVVLLAVAAGPGYASFLTIAAVVTEEIAYHRYRSWRDFALLVYGAIAENVGFRQIRAWWRCRGIAEAILSRRPPR